MNYSDEILENKAFNFFKLLMYNIVLAICIILVVCLVLVYGFKFRPYEVLSDSMAPVFTAGDMVVVKAQDEYEVGDILKFDSSGTPTTHRLLEIREVNGTTYYLCHGDNVNDLTSEDLGNMTWEEISQDISIQRVTLPKIEGKVVASFDNWGSYFNFIGDHKLLIIAIIVSIWCVSATVQNEIEFKRDRRILEA